MSIGGIFQFPYFQTFNRYIFKVTNWYVYHWEKRKKNPINKCQRTIFKWLTLSKTRSILLPKKKRKLKWWHRIFQGQIKRKCPQHFNFFDTFPSIWCKKKVTQKLCILMCTFCHFRIIWSWKTWHCAYASIWVLCRVFVMFQFLVHASSIFI